MHFQYFFPDRRSIKLEQLLEAGLGYVFDPETSAKTKTPFNPIQVNNGPGGKHGLIVSLSDEHIGYYKDKQVWKQEIDTEYWVGMWTDSAKRPTPESLARENQIKGQWLRLADGHDWLLPMARHWVEIDDELRFEHTLPTRLTRNAAGYWRSGEVTERYRELWRIATDLMSAYVTNSFVEFTEEDNAVVECFKTNYRVSAMEIDLLGIYEHHLRSTALQVLMDIENFDLLMKKKLTTLDTGDSFGGQPEQTEEPIAQPSQT
jgi:hypothetical protein